MQHILDKKVWAVLGATHRKEKFGYKIFRHMVDHGYIVYPINPNLEEIDGITCYPSVESLPEIPDVVDFVVPEKIGLQALDECKKKGVSIIWLQPGADTKAVLAKAKELQFEVVQDCVLIQVK